MGKAMLALLDSIGALVSNDTDVNQHFPMSQPAFEITVFFQQGYLSYTFHAGVMHEWNAYCKLAEESK